MALTRGDSTKSFGGKFITINVVNNTGHPITRAEWRCGKILKVIDKPTFPYDLQLTSEETRQLQDNNTCYLACYDENGDKRTCTGKLVYKTNPEVV